MGHRSVQRAKAQDLLSEVLSRDTRSDRERMIECKLCTVAFRSAMPAYGGVFPCVEGSMLQVGRRAALALVAWVAFPAAAWCGDVAPSPVVGCAAAAENEFVDQVWAKVAAVHCLICHRK